ncbi:hypothetical protein PUN28_005177 [Cardiocondyla obscurior]|uniref:Uncharacterized protein n=1 Tax=Cardiocondyla obscurior TaxID=286306 RepID=A0AAW2GKG0_9HYME
MLFYFIFILFNCINSNKNSRAVLISFWDAIDVFHSASSAAAISAPVAICAITVTNYLDDMRQLHVFIFFLFFFLLITSTGREMIFLIDHH